MEDIQFSVLPPAEIDLIRPLWEKLRGLHQERSLFFASEYEVMTFEKRKDKLRSGGRTDWRAEVARAAPGGEIVAYCLSSITRDLEGEIDSIYVEPAYRRFRVADALMRHALGWLDERGAVSNRVSVAVGNEQALPFYEFYHFYPRYIMLLERKP
jgi:ribosomal protein S18 acetylase RimI-like enzyme